MALINSYSGSVTGIGNASNRINEITGDNLANFRNFVFGYESGVIKCDNHDFDYSIDENTIKITDGYCFAYGYGAYHEAKEFTILPPAVEQYYLIYIRIDKSVIPNTCELLIKNNYSSPNVGINTFRQDTLSVIKTGVYEIPLWLIKATNNGINSNLKDLRPLRKYFQNVVYSDNSHTVMNGGILENGVTTPTPLVLSNNDIVANDRFVRYAFEYYLSTTFGEEPLYKVNYTTLGAGNDSSVEVLILGEDQEFTISSASVDSKIYLRIKVLDTTVEITNVRLEEMESGYEVDLYKENNGLYYFFMPPYDVTCMIYLQEV